MELNDTLKLLALQLQLDPNELIRLAAEDVIGGYHFDPLQSRWGIGSLFEVEGKVLYALVRILKPSHVVEIGSLRGCSTAHLATALQVNGSGHLTAVDLDGTARDKFPKHLESVLTGVTADGLEWLAGQEDESIDLLFEDSSHGESMCASVASLCKTKLAPGGVLIMHDAAHDNAILGDGNKIASPVGAEVRAGLDRAIANEYRVYLSEPSDCGFACYLKPYNVTFQGSDAIYSGKNTAMPDEYKRLTERLQQTTWDITPIHEGVSPLAELISSEDHDSVVNDVAWEDELGNVSSYEGQVNTETGLSSHLENDVPTNEPEKLASKTARTSMPLSTELERYLASIDVSADEWDTMTPAEKIGIKRPNINPANPIAVALGEMLNKEIDAYNTEKPAKKKPGRKPKSQTL